MGNYRSDPLDQGQLEKAMALTCSAMHGLLGTMQVPCTDMHILPSTMQVPCIDVHGLLCGGGFGQCLASISWHYTVR